MKESSENRRQNLGPKKDTKFSILKVTKIMQKIGPDKKTKDKGRKMMKMNNQELNQNRQIYSKKSEIRSNFSDFGLQTSASGITLIALIITIIVMLILVAVTVSSVVNSGLFKHASTASEEWKQAQEQEQRLANGELNFGVGNKKYNSIDSYLAGRPLVPEGITIPAGFTMSGRSDEQTIDDGLVIYEIPEEVDTNRANFWTETVQVGDQTYPKVQTEYNQFVWVPVETPYVTKEKLAEIIASDSSITTEKEALQSLANSGTYPMAVKISDTDYRGVLYDFSVGTNGVKMTVSEYSSEANYNSSSVTYKREPAKLSSTEVGKVDQNKEPDLNMQTEYNNAVKSVANQKGFWVARYELSCNATSSKGESKRGKTVANAGSSSLRNWYGLYEASKTVVNNGNVKSTMISGSQWDQIMIWMKEVKNKKDSTKYYILDSSYMGNYSVAAGGTGVKQVSGYKNEYGVKQVYDLGGNLCEWTTEAVNTHFRIVRGGDYNGSESYFIAASGRLLYVPNGIPIDRHSARSALYVTL